MNSSSYLPSFSMALVQLCTMRGISDPVAMMYWSTSPPKSFGTSPGIELPYASTPTVTGGLQAGGKGGDTSYQIHSVTISCTYTFCSSVGSRQGGRSNVQEVWVDRGGEKEYREHTMLYSLYLPVCQVGTY